MINIIRTINADLESKFSEKGFIEKSLIDYKRRLEQDGDGRLRKSLTEDLKTIERKISNLVAAVADGFDRSVAIPQMNNLREERASIHAQLQQLESSHGVVNDIPSADLLRSSMRHFLSTRPGLKNENLFNLYLMLIEKVLLYPGKIVVVYRYFPETVIPLSPVVLNSRSIDMVSLVRDLGKLPMKDLQTKYKATGNGIRYNLKKMGLKNGRYSVKN